VAHCLLNMLYDYSVRQDISDTSVYICEKVKDLRVIIDSKLSFKDHITEKVKFR